MLFFSLTISFFYIFCWLNWFILSSSLSAAEKPGLVPRLISKLKAKLKGKTEELSQSPPLQPQQSSPMQPPKLLLKVVFVAVVAVVWHLYFNGNWDCGDYTLAAFVCSNRRSFVKYTVILIIFPFLFTIHSCLHKQFLQLVFTTTKKRLCLCYFATDIVIMWLCCTSFMITLP